MQKVVVFLAKGLVDFDEFLVFFFFFVIPLVVHMMSDLENDFWWFELAFWSHAKVVFVAMVVKHYIL